jgi:hypothetical protein
MPARSGRSSKNVSSPWDELNEYNLTHGPNRLNATTAIPRIFSSHGSSGTIGYIWRSKHFGSYKRNHNPWPVALDIAAIIDEITIKYVFASERNPSMYKYIAIYALLLLFFVPQTLFSQKTPLDTPAILVKADAILATLSDSIDRLENIQSDLEKTSIANENYNEQKNIWLSSGLSISTIKSICEYEHALFTLFMELREKNQRRYYDVRHRSLATSAQQINIMYEQIKINHTLISHDPSERYIIEKESYAIQTILDLFKQSIDLIISLKEQSGK